MSALGPKPIQVFSLFPLLLNKANATVHSLAFLRGLLGTVICVFYLLFPYCLEDLPIMENETRTKALSVTKPSLRRLLSWRTQLSAVAVAAAEFPQPANRHPCTAGPVTNRTKSYKLSLQNINRRSLRHRILLSIRELSWE